MSKINSGVFSSALQDWQTPWIFIEAVQKKFNVKIELDVCADEISAKAPHFFSLKENAFTKSWDASVCWMNPPYGKALPKWLEFARDQQIRHKNLILCLVPARTDTKWFHEIAVDGRVYFLKGSIKFEHPLKQHSTSPAFPSMLVVFGKPKGFEVWDWKRDI